MDREQDDQQLVTEQPALKVIFWGFVISWVLSLLLQGWLAPHRLRAHIEKAAASMHRDVKVTFDSVEMRLADGILPRFQVVVQGVRMTSGNPCWGQAELSADQIRLPISLSGLWTGSGIVQRVEAGQVDIYVADTAQACAEIQKNQKSSQAQKSPPEKAVSEAVSGEAVAAANLPLPQSISPSKNNIRLAFIDSLRLRLQKYPGYEPQILNIRAEVKEDKPIYLSITAKTHLLKDEQVGDFLSHANILLEYRESPEKTLHAHVYGNWREGHYSLIGSCTLLDQLCQLESELKHIPVSQVLRIVQRLTEQEMEKYKAKKMWVSMRLKASGDARRAQDFPIEISNVKLEGDLGNVHIDHALINRLSPLAYEPFNIQLLSVNLRTLLNVLGLDPSSKIFGSMGQFTGKLEMTSADQFKMYGEHSGLEFIFANKGQRELQKILRMNVDFLMKQNQWIAILSRVEPEQGVLDGEIRLTGVKDKKEVNIRTRIDELSLNPVVQNLMTQKGSIAPLKLNADMKLTEGKVTALKGHLRLPLLKVEDMSINQIRAQFDYVADKSVINLQMKEVELTAGGVAANILQPIAQKVAMDKLNDFSGIFKTKDFKSLEWRNVSAKLKTGERLITDGGWNEKSELSGHVLIKTPKGGLDWQILGLRDTPVLEAKP